MGCHKMWSAFYIPQGKLPNPQQSILTCTFVVTLNSGKTFSIKFAMSNKTWTNLNI